ncbi:MAG: hypothetical protein H6574_15645 [Lewinellaceae bacterium]|nr:hypothetical protein [Saprospiraceae bacterium]MCB9332515.1 hypothetical protein [Lewinellaceae bacterium]
MKKSLFLFAMLFSLSVFGQTEQAPHPSSIGLEADVLPYITGGYYGSVWYARDHLRYRAVYTKLTTPEFMLSEGFANNKMRVYTLLVDYFFKPSVDKWWVGAGFEYWDAQIQTDQKLTTANYNTVVFTVGGGHVWKFYRNFYLNPWAALHLRVAGDTEVPVDERVFEPALFIPEGSLKIGWYFNQKK